MIESTFVIWKDVWPRITSSAVISLGATQKPSTFLTGGLFHPFVIVAPPARNPLPIFTMLALAISPPCVAAVTAESDRKSLLALRSSGALRFAAGYSGGRHAGVVTASSGSDSAHSRYNALVRRLVSFERA